MGTVTAGCKQSVDMGDCCQVFRALLGRRGGDGVETSTSACASQQQALAAGCTVVSNLLGDVECHGGQVAIGIRLAVLDAVKALGARGSNGILQKHLPFRLGPT